MGPRVIGEEHEIFRSHLEKWGAPNPVIDGLMGYHNSVSYAPGSVVFRPGSPADIMFWVIRGVVKVYCQHPDGSRTLVRVAGSGEILGEVDAVDERGQWVRLFEAQALTRCVFAMVTRQHLVTLFERLGPETVVGLSQRMNSAWASRVSYYAEFLGCSFRQRLEIVLKDLGDRFGVREKEGILLTFQPVHADLAEMIGSSRPMVSRLMTELVDEGAIARRGKQYILLNGGCLMVNTRRALGGREVEQVPGGGQKRDASMLRRSGAGGLVNGGGTQTKQA